VDIFGDGSDARVAKSIVEAESFSMTRSTDERLRAIGAKAVALADDLAGPLLLYAEADENVISADILYLNSRGDVRLKFCTPALRHEVYNFWQDFQELPGSFVWHTMQLVVSEGKLTVEYLRPDEVDLDLDVSDRRPDVIRKHFGSAPVDSSRPD
jgi:hypothetical protein